MYNKRAYFKDLIHQHPQSGKSINSFCRDNGVSEGQFHYWKHKINTTTESTKVSMIPLTIINEHKDDSIDTIPELVYPNGVTLKLRQSTTKKELISFITLLD